MTYLASLLRQQIARRLNGECRLSIPRGKAVSFCGDTLSDFTSCADCDACEIGNATGLLGKTLQMRIVSRGDEVRIEYACPECGRNTTETASLLRAHATAEEIEADPLCFSCRQRWAQQSAAK